MYWTPERRARQAELIRAARPWERSTGPTTAAGKAVSARNAYRGGYRQRCRSRRSLLRLLESAWDAGLSADAIEARLLRRPDLMATLIDAPDPRGGQMTDLPCALKDANTE